MKRFLINQPLGTSIYDMSEGNPGALNVLIQLIGKEDKNKSKEEAEKRTIQGLIYLSTLDELEIYGSNIWICYKDICNQDINKLIPKIMDKSIKKDLEKTKRYVKL